MDPDDERDPLPYIMSVIWRAGRLSQQLLIDLALLVESNNLRYITTHQTQMRADLYNKLQDHVFAEDADDQPLRLGAKVILPSTHKGSARYMQQHFQDAMAIVVRLGRPSLFLTMTCNPKWRDSLREIPEGHDPRNYPLITHRVFALKLKKMLDLLFKDGIFGRKIGSIYVIEFQKRGLPHAHILLILAPEDRPLTAAEVDDMISAELPDEATEPRYYKYVTSHMMHGPCGKENPAAPCMHDPRYPGRCSKGYPKKFCDATKLDNEKGPEYRRHDNGRTFTKKGAKGVDAILSNAHVIAHNRYLGDMFDCHINVELVYGMRSVKYVFKYVCKGSDRSKITLYRNAPGACAPQCSGIYLCYIYWAFYLQLLPPFLPALLRTRTDQAGGENV